jgi:hypothetical protein
MILYLVCTTGGAEQASCKPDAELLDPDPQTQIDPDPIGIGNSASYDACCMIFYLVCTSGGTEQAGREPDGERHGALAQGEGEALPQAGEAVTEETKTPSW